MKIDISDALTPLDGRNRRKTVALTQYFSDFAYTKYRVMVELKYLEKLSTEGIIRKFTDREKKLLTLIWYDFSHVSYDAVRAIEKTTNHDAKAVELYVIRTLQKSSLADVSGMVHFGLTSDDVNNIAYACMVRDAVRDVLCPLFIRVRDDIRKKSSTWKGIAMVGRTHGLPAAPTTLGKELYVFYSRLKAEIKMLESLKLRAKLSGNTGNLNAHKALYPKFNWRQFAEDFVTSFDLTSDPATTQIEPYDSYIRLFDSIRRLNWILHSFSQDMWQYVLLRYFKQKVVQKEVGSTALPHKVNPIYFEGAEGGFELANSLFEMYGRELMHSRLQRDLSDSTIRRTFGIAFGYTLMSVESVTEGLARIEPDTELITRDLGMHWEVLSEPIQNFLRIKGYANAYDQAKRFFRGRVTHEKDVAHFITSLKLSDVDKKLLLSLRPENYTGYAAEIVDSKSK